jgi:hypothetical protein
MAVVQGIREKIHAPLYDAIVVEPGKQLRDAVRNGSALKLFVDVQEKTKLHTNLQSASLLPHYNTFEARAMRVVISDLPPEYPDSEKQRDDDWDLTDDEGLLMDKTGKVEGDANFGNPVKATLNLSLDYWMELLEQARESEDGEAELLLGDLEPEEVELTEQAVKEDLNNLGVIFLPLADIEITVRDRFKLKAPPKEQLRPRDGAGDIIGKLIYNTVTTLYVGEKIMVQAPTWLFPAGAGPYSETGKFTTHGEPNPLATFRFAEPIYIDKQQNFRVELEVPDADVFSELKQLYGPLYIWVVLDGYMTRDVQ